MDKIQALKERREALKKAGADIRAKIAALCDEDSFVELAAFGFSKDTFYGEDAQGEGVVTGFATIGGYPFSIVAQNFAVSKGGLSKANCEKIVKLLSEAERKGEPVVYILHSFGVRIGEGTPVLEGIAGLLKKATELKGSVLQFAILDGEVYGSTAALAAVADCVMFTDGAVLSANSPFVLSAKAGKNMKPAEVGGYAAGGRGLPALKVKDMRDAAGKILEICDFIKVPVIDADLNTPEPALNQCADAAAIFKLLESSVELGANFCPELKTVLARVGGIAVAAAVFDDLFLSENNVRKLRSFAEFACCFGLPLVTFVDCGGIEPTLAVANSPVLKEIREYLSVLGAMDAAKIAVVTGKAVGIGYSLFAAKSAGFDYTVALATARISLFDSEEGAEIEYSPKAGDKERFAARYADEHADPMNAAAGGYLDDVIEPQFLKQYLVASLETLAK